MSAYNQYGAPPSYMSYPQGLQGQHQAYSTAQQIQQAAMYGGMASYAQLPTSGSNGMPPPATAAPGAPGVVQDDMNAAASSFEQMSLGPPGPGPQATQMAPTHMQHMSSYGQHMSPYGGQVVTSPEPGQVTTPYGEAAPPPTQQGYPPAHDYARAYMGAPPPGGGQVMK